MWICFAPLEPLLAAISPLLSTTKMEHPGNVDYFLELILIFMSQPSLPANQQMILFSAVADPLSIY